MKKGKSIFYYIRYKNLSAEILSFNAQISLKNTMLMYIFYTAVCVGLGALLKLKPICLIIVAGASLLFAPYIVFCSYKNEFEQKRFSDISQYMQQLLYSFRSTGSIKTSLQDTMTIFESGSYMNKLIQEALVILDSPNYSKDATRAAFEVIENEFACERLFTIHDFLEKAEKNGGDYGNTIDLLLADRTFWVDRKALFQVEKKAKKLEIVGAIFVTVLLCCAMKLMPMEYDYTKHILFQITGVSMMVFDLIVYVLTCRKMTVGWLSEREIYEEKTTITNYEYVVNYDEKREKRKSYMWLVFPGVLLILGVFTHKYLLSIVGGLLTPVMLYQHRIKYALCMKELREEIQLKFPRWLMEITLLLQSMNVQKAIFSSIENAPIVLIPELNKFKDALMREPTSATPYLEFMRSFKIPEITASMNMLYSLSQGQGMERDEDSQKELAEIINRNNKLLDQAEKKADKKALLVFSSYFFMPQFSACVMLMVILLISTVGSFSVLSNL